MLRGVCLHTSHHRMHTSRRWPRYTRTLGTLDHAHMPIAHVVRFRSQRGCCQILSDDAYEKAMGALSKYRMAAPRRSNAALGITRARQFAHDMRGIRDSNRSRHRGLACGFPIPLSTQAHRPGLHLAQGLLRACNGSGMLRSAAVRRWGRTPALAFDLWTSPARTKPSWPSFFPAAAPPRTISRVGPRRTGSSRPLRSKKHAHSGPPLRCGRHGSAARRRP